MKIKHLTAIFLMLMLTACATVGKEFDGHLVDTVQSGKTTKQEILSMFGEPFKTGMQNGDEIWVYETNRYKVVGEDSSKNFTVVFDSRGVVRSHQMMSSDPTP